MIGNGFRIVDNSAFKLSPTYPPFFAVPSGFEEAAVRKTCDYRSKARLPATTYCHPLTRASMSRCAQTLSGLTGKSCAEDVLLLKKLREGNPSNKDVLWIIDARPRAAAVGNKVMGKGAEKIDMYKGCKLRFMNIDNIHAMRGAAEKYPSCFCCLSLFFFLLVEKTLLTP